MRQLQDGAAPKAGRLLRLLFLRFGEVSPDAGRELYLFYSLVALAPPIEWRTHDRFTSHRPFEHYLPFAKGKRPTTFSRGVSKRCSTTKPNWHQHTWTPTKSPMIRFSLRQPETFSTP